MMDSGNYGDGSGHGEPFNEDEGAGSLVPRTGKYSTPEPKFGWPVPAHRNINDKDPETLQEMYEMAEEGIIRMEKIMAILIDLNRYQALTLGTQIRDELRIARREALNALGRQGLTLDAGKDG